MEANEDETKKLMRAADRISMDRMSDDCQLMEQHVIPIVVNSSDDNMEVGPSYKGFNPSNTSSKAAIQESIFKLTSDELKVLDIQNMKLTVSFVKNIKNKTIILLKISFSRISASSSWATTTRIHFL